MRHQNKSQATKSKKPPTKTDDELIKELSKLQKAGDKNSIAKFGKELISQAIKSWGKHETLRLILKFISDILT